ncbi:MAG: PEP-CTERM sorting domain-containing protein [Terriglobia bacterium]
MKKMAVWLLLGTGLMAVAGLSALGSTIPMFNECPAVGQDTGCAVLITINSGGALSYQMDSSQPPSFNTTEADTLVGVLNNSGALQYSIDISGNNIFGFDFNGSCLGTYTPNPSRCPDLFNAPTSYEGYDMNGNFDSFTVTSLNGGTIYFANGLTPGDSAFFSLEGSPSDINGVTSTTPEPASVLLLGTGLFVLAMMSRKWLAENPQQLN